MASRVSAVFFCICALAIQLQVACAAAGGKAPPPFLARSKRQSSSRIGFEIISPQILAATDLSSTCKGVLTQTIACDPYVTSFASRQYFGSLEDASLAESVCQASCGRALQTAERRIQGACASTPDLFPGHPVGALIEPIVYGWQDVCLIDDDTGEYCNDLIDGWDEAGDYESLQDMPEDELCSYCYVTKLRMMQQSPWSVYDDYFAEALIYVNDQCGEVGDTAPQPDPIGGGNSTEETTECQAGGERYMTQEGDSCDSIAQAHSVSAATLYYINPDLLNCADTGPGLELCLPPSCESVHVVQEDDVCVDVAVSQGASWENIIAWNMGIDNRCSNLWSRNPFWGRTICTSAPGGEYVDGGSGEGDGGSGGAGGDGGNTGGEGGSGSGYADRIVDPPKGGDVAEGTTLRCGEFVQAQASVGCPSMVSTRAVPMNLFLAVNPSLGTALECDGNLQEGHWYCLRPHRSWNIEDGFRR